ncbi:hypothetical protein YN1_0540 [Nanoarchaeota archaeon]
MSSKLDNILNDIKDMKDYDEFINYIRSDINREFKSTMYLGYKTNGSVTTLKKEEIFPIIYGRYFIPRVFNYNNNRKIIPDYTYDIIKIAVVFQLDGNKEKRYIKEIGQERKDIYIDYDRSKMPESVILESENDDDIKKLVQTVPYNGDDPDNQLKESIKIIRDRSEKVYTPTILFIPLLHNNPYFLKINYMSKPYFQLYPYSFTVYLGSREDVLVPDYVENNLLSSLLLTDIVPYPTLEPTLLNLDYKFEFDKNNLEKGWYIEEHVDEVNNKFSNIIKNISNAIIELKYLPEDISSYQISIKDNKPIFFDIGSGIQVVLNKDQLKKVVVSTLGDIIDGMTNSPLLKHCRINNSILQCGRNIETKKEDLYKLIEDITGIKYEDTTYMSYKNLYTDILGELERKYEIFNDSFRKIDNLRDEEFYPIKYYLEKVIEIYLRSRKII